MEGILGLAATGGYQWLGVGEEGLDRAVVAGLMLDAALGTGPRPPDLQTWAGQLKIRVQESLLNHLAGRISLDRFHALINALNRCFPFYLPLISTLLQPAVDSADSHRALTGRGDLLPSCSRAVRGDLLGPALRHIQGLLPRRPHSKLQADKLVDFLIRTCGRWFRLRDFQEHFSVERKTAWEYVQKLWSARILCHNRGRAAAVRYGLVDRFLIVQGEAIRGHAAAALYDLDPGLGPRVADLLIGSGGEPFWEEDWRRHLAPGPLQEILQRLTAPGSLLEVVSTAPGGSRLLRLRLSWLQSPGETS